MKISLFVCLALIWALFGFLPSIYAQTPTINGCEPIYGGGENCPATNIAIDKMVFNPQKNVFVDNLGVNDFEYKSGDIVTFQVKVTNTGSTTISTFTVKDVFPNFLLFATGPGTFDTASHTLIFDVTNLTPNQVQTFTITGKVASTDQLSHMPSSCLVNQAIATNLTGEIVQDTAQFCIDTNNMNTNGPTNISSTETAGGNGISGATSKSVTVNTNGLPKTGTDAFVFVGLILMGIFGYQIINNNIKI